MDWYSCRFFSKSPVIISGYLYRAISFGFTSAIIIQISPGVVEAFFFIILLVIKLDFSGIFLENLFCNYNLKIPGFYFTEFPLIFLGIPQISWGTSSAISPGSCNFIKNCSYKFLRNSCGFLFSRGFVSRIALLFYLRNLLR